MSPSTLHTMPAAGTEPASSNGVATASTRLEYEVVDVFTAHAFAGNPLAVVYGGDDLTTQQMLAMATEFNLSETAFPVALTAVDRSAGADYRLRIFTPGGEIPFAGHPTLGSAWALHQRGAVAAGGVVQACAAGLIRVRLPSEPDGPVELSAAPRDAARQLSEVDIADVVPLVALDAEDVAGPAYIAGCGLTWLYLQVSPEAVARARPSSVRLSEVGLDQTGLTDPMDGIDVFALDPASPDATGALSISSRVFVPGFGIPEDPATGSAAVGLGLALVAAGHARPDGETWYRIEQGVQMGRPSLLVGRVDATAGVATRAHVCGHVVPVAAGTIAVPPQRH
jgi:trans-2,3-dihydro-3-hydroxyanthranilate isomerase